MTHSLVYGTFTVVGVGAGVGVGVGVGFGVGVGVGIGAGAGAGAGVFTMTGVGGITGAAVGKALSCEFATYSFTACPGCSGRPSLGSTRVTVLGPLFGS
jgi:hypothetical protein